MKEGRPAGRKVVDQAANEAEELIDAFGLDVATFHEAKRYAGTIARRARAAGLKVVRYDVDDPARDSLIVARKGLRAWGRRLHKLERKGWERRPGRPGLHHPRSAVSAVVGGVRIVAVHMPPTPGLKAYPRRDAAWDNSLATLARLGRRWNRWGRPWVMTGDWNRAASSPEVREFVRRLGAKVYSNGGIDYVIARGVGIKDLRREDFGGSDHAPVLFNIVKE
ncbi:hypothetical protein LRP67_16175 [Nocardioides sp. cx-169]|uniref:hypothetical protein n=1 Tax=Nocardioides sp. cx-169 TaxID=2899080 RepID=UPI001E363AC6|nr:hypothetical protein [Nocardioides sp. cx-169]MCD4535630.1 hypothetical protein [Nocardioides sp. cx-169]